MAATNGAEPDVEHDNSIKPPESVIVPPKGIRDNIVTMVSFLSRKSANDREKLEDQVKVKNGNDSKFSFLFETDAYHPYFDWYRTQVYNGVIVSGDGQGQPKAREKRRGPPPPADFHFSVRMPNISAQDLEVIKLTARYTAYKGRPWMNQLLQRESTNYQFDFLRPNHSLHQFFTRLVDQYLDLKNAGTTDDGNIMKERIAELEHNIQDRFHILDRAKQRAEYVKYQDQQKAKEFEKQEKEKLEYAQIDWHDFVIVATITFDQADENAELSAPWNLNDLQSQTLEQKAQRTINPNMRIDEAMPGDETYWVTGQQPGQAPPDQPAWAPQPQPSPQPAGYQQPPPQEDDEARYIRERQEERQKAQQAQAAAKGNTGSVRIRNDYVPRAAAARRQNVQMALCPNCKQQIPVDEMDEHMRIELLDPQWKAQRAREAARYSTTNLSTINVADNLKRLASQRDDVFDGVTGLPISEEEQARRKKAATSYDGHPDAKNAVQMQQMQSMNVEEQLRQIKQKFQQTGNQNPNLPNNPYNHG